MTASGARERDRDRDLMFAPSSSATPNSNLTAANKITSATGGGGGVNKALLSSSSTSTTTTSSLQVWLHFVTKPRLSKTALI